MSTNEHRVKGNGFGKRGEAWVLAQVALLALFLLVPRVGPMWPGALAFRIAGAAAVLAGLAVLGYSALCLGHSLTPFPRPLPSASMVTSGPYRLVRHPIYSGVLLAALGFSLFSLSPLRLVLTLALLIFFDRKASREEQWLLERYPQYGAYRRRTKKLVPWIY